MKTAISLPDRLFETAERLAQELGVTRSAFYRRAIERYVAELDASEVTARLDRIYAGSESGLDPGLLALELASLDAEDW